MSQRLLVARLVALVTVVLAILTLVAPPATATAEAAAWTRPVPGPLVRPFTAPPSAYGPGHRGADLAATPGTPVVAMGAGVVVFAGAVGGTLHVVVDHGHGLRTSVSFLAAVTVTRGQHVAAGAVLGVSGGTGPDHAADRVHIAARRNDEYVDPMRLLAPLDVASAIRLAPVAPPAHDGLPPAADESRALAHELRLPTALPAWVASGDAWRRSAAGQTGRCSVATDGPGSTHRLLAVAGIGSRTDPRSGATFALDAAALGYEPDEVRWLSYRDDGRPYAPSDTFGSLDAAAVRLGEELRAMQRVEPGREVDLVAHSQGGVVVDVFLRRHYDPTDPTLPPIGGVVTLASPHAGAPLAGAVTRARARDATRALLDGAGRVLPAAVPPASAGALRDLAPGSAAVRSNRVPDGHLDVTSIGGVDDVVVPADRTRLPGARQVIVDPRGIADHGAIVRDPVALDATRLALEGRPPPCAAITGSLRARLEPAAISAAERAAGAALERAGRAATPLAVGARAVGALGGWLAGR